MKKITFISLLVLLLFAPVSQAQIPQGPMTDLLMYYADLYSTPQIPTPVFAKKLLAKAQPDECFNGIGNPYPSGPPCSEGKPKVNQAYVWGLTQEGNLWFGTVANMLCLVPAAALGQLGGMSIDPFELSLVACEFGDSQYLSEAPVPLDPAFGDWRPPQIWEYNQVTGELKEHTLEAGPLINQVWGLRSAGSMNGVIFLAGPSLKQDSISMFAFKSDGTFLGAKQFDTFSDIRKWTVYDGYLYCGVGNTSKGGGGGSILKWIDDPNNPAYPFQFEVVGKLDGGGANITSHEGRLFVTTWAVGRPLSGLWYSPIVPPGGLTSADAPNWKKVWKVSDYEPDMLVAQTYAGGDLASFDGTLFWGTMHIPGIPLLFAMQAAQAGQINLDPAGDGLGTDDLLTTFLGTLRSTSIFSGKNFGTSGQQIELLYGNQYLPVYDPAAKSYTIAEDAMHQNKMPNPVAKWGTAGMGNLFNTYEWTMTVGFKGPFQSLLVGTFDDSLVIIRGLVDMLTQAAAQGGGQDAAAPAVQLDPAMINDVLDELSPYVGFGSDLFVARSADEPFILDSNDGQGNYLNYGIRTFQPSETGAPQPDSLSVVQPPQDFVCETTTTEVVYMGMADPMNIATDPNKPQGGWELIQLSVPISPLKGTIGTRITIAGSFCYPGKIEVYIGDKKCKVIGWNESEIYCEIISVLPPGVYDIEIKQKGCPTIEYDAVFEIYPPVICSIAPKRPGCGTEFIAKGKFFGNDKGVLKMYIGQNNNWQKCKIYGSQMTAETGDSWCDFVVPKVKVGTYDVKIENKVGSSVFAGGVNICK